MVHTDGFVGKQKVKNQWKDGGFIVESQLEDWPVYKVRCPTTDARQKPKYRILHRNRLLFVTDEDASATSGQAQAKATPTVSNATLEAFFSGCRCVRKASTVLGDSTRRWTDLSGVVEWQIQNEALDTNDARGSTESSGLD